MQLIYTENLNLAHTFDLVKLIFQKTLDLGDPRLFFVFGGRLEYVGRRVRPDLELFLVVL